MNTKSLQKRLDRMIETLERRVEQQQQPPLYGLILFKPLEEVEHGEQRMSNEEYRARIMQEQPAVQARFEELRSQGCHVWVWLPETDDLPGPGESENAA